MAPGLPVRGRQKVLAIGVYPTVGLKEARTAREDAKRLLANGVDPSAAKKQTKLEPASSIANTFEPIARELVKKKRDEGKANNTITKTEWLLGFAYPIIGSRPIKEIGAPDVLAVLRAIEARGRRETARGFVQPLDRCSDTRSRRRGRKRSQMIRCGDNALRLSADPNLAYRAGLRMHVSSYGMYGFATLSSTSFRQTERFADLRFRVPETTQAFALAKLEESGEADVLAKRHAYFFQSRLGRLNQNISELKIERDAIDLDNVRAALRYAIGPEGNTDLALSLAAGALPLWLGLSLMAECHSRIEEVLASLTPRSGPALTPGS